MTEAEVEERPHGQKAKAEVEEMLRGPMIEAKVEEMVHGQMIEAKAEATTHGQRIDIKVELRPHGLMKKAEVEVMPLGRTTRQSRAGKGPKAKARVIVRMAGLPSGATVSVRTGHRRRTSPSSPRGAVAIGQMPRIIGQVVGRKMPAVPVLPQHLPVHRLRSGRAHMQLSQRMIYNSPRVSL